MTKVGFMDSSGIGALVALRLHADALGHEVAVVPSRRVHAALRLARLDDVFQANRPDDPTGSRSA